MQPLKLAALDEEDLAILSAHFQDAVLVAADLTYLARAKRFAMVANRFCWERAARAAAEPSDTTMFERRRTGLHFERVLAVKARGIDPKDKELVLELLAITFEPGDAPPAGIVHLMFAGGKDIRLEVECIEAAASDLGLAWETPHLPAHATGEPS